MTYELINKILTDSKIKFTYYQFKNHEEIKGLNRYIAYFESEKLRVVADDKVWHHEPNFAVELYTKTKDLEAENILIQLFAENEVTWSGGESVYIDEEDMYQTVFYV